MKKVYLCIKNYSDDYYSPPIFRKGMLCAFDADEIKRMDEFQLHFEEFDL